MKKSRAGRPGCLANILFVVLVLVLAFFIYKWITSLGSARIVITNLSVAERIGRSGEPIEGSKLVDLNLTNTGNQPGAFAFDLENYREAHKLEEKEIGPNPDVWSFKTEIYFSLLDKWVEYPNSDLWGGSKITPGALEITMPVGETLELQAYLKDSRGWRIRMPSGPSGASEEQLPLPERLRISILSPKGSVSSSEEIDI
jgi:hypothetical protein